MNKPSTKIGKIYRRETYLAVGLLSTTVIGALLASLSLGKIRSEYSIHQFLPKSHPLMTQDMEVRDRFKLSRGQPVLVTLELKKGHWLLDENLKKLEATTKAIPSITNVRQAVSLATVQSADQSDSEFSVVTLSKLPMKVRRDRIRKDRFITPTLVSSNLKLAVIAVMLEYNISNQGIEQALEKVRETAAKAFPAASVQVGGVPAIQAQLTSMVKRELFRFMGLALLASCFTLALVFSTPMSAVIPFITIFVTNIFVLFFMVLGGFPMTILAATIPILVSVNVLSLTTHTMLRLSEEGQLRPFADTQKFSGKVILVFKTLQYLALPNLLAALTTSFGFATLAMENVPLIRDFGLVVAVAMVVSWVSTTLIMMPMLILMPLPVARPWVLHQATWVRSVFQHRKAVVVSALIFVISMVFVGRNLNWGSRLFDDLPEGEEARLVTEESDRNLGGMIPLELLISLPGKEPWNEPSALVKLDKLQDRFRRHHDIGSVVGVPDLLRQVIGRPDAKIPKTRKAIAERWFILGMAAENPLRNYMTSDGRTIRVGMRLHDRPSHQVQKLLKEVRAEAKKAFPKSTVQLGGMGSNIHFLNDSLSRSLLVGFWLALGVIGLLLLGVFRSVRWTFVSMLPNLMPASILLGLLAIFETPIKPGVAIVFAIALGFSFDNTIYILMRLKGILKNANAGIAREIENTLRVEGNPCLVSIICLLSGFTIFLFSSFDINRTFGLYMLAGLMASVASDLIFMPALIQWAPWLLGEKQKAGMLQLDYAEVPQSEALGEPKPRLAKILPFPLRKPLVRDNEDADQVADSSDSSKAA